MIYNYYILMRVDSVSPVQVTYLCLNGLNYVDHTGQLWEGFPNLSFDTNIERRVNAGLSEFNLLITLAEDVYNKSIKPFIPALRDNIGSKLVLSVYNQDEEEFFTVFTGNFSNYKLSASDPNKLNLILSFTNSFIDRSNKRMITYNHDTYKTATNGDNFLKFLSNVGNEPLTWPKYG